MIRSMLVRRNVLQYDELDEERIYGKRVEKWNAWELRGEEWKIRPMWLQMASLRGLYCIIEWRDWNVRGKRILWYIVEEQINAISLAWTTLSMACLSSETSKRSCVRIWFVTSQSFNVERGLYDLTRCFGPRLGNGLMIDPLVTDEVITAKNMQRAVNKSEVWILIGKIDHGGWLRSTSFVLGP